MKQLALIFFLLLGQANPFDTVGFPACPNAKYTDSKNIDWTCVNCQCIPYYKELEDHGNDPGLCGIAPFETGTWDPLYQVCRRHDAQYDYQKDNDGKVKESILVTQLHFTIDAAKQGFLGLYAAIAAPIFITLVWLVGAPIQLFRQATGDDNDDTTKSDS